VAADQFRQKAERLLFQFQPKTILPKFSRGTVELERTKTKELPMVRHIWIGRYQNIHPEANVRSKHLLLRDILAEEWRAQQLSGGYSDRL
jgi:hypothetical protein